MDAIEFATTHRDELKARLANAVNPHAFDGSQPDDNHGLTPEDVVKKFFDDQDHDFENIDIQAVLALTK